MKDMPAIGHYVRDLDLSTDEYDDFPRTLQCLTRLQSLSIGQVKEPTDWRSLTWPNRNALLRLMHLPTFSSLTLFYVHNFLLSDLLHATNLRCLNIRFTTFFEDAADAPPIPISLPPSVQPRELDIVSNPEELGICIKEIAKTRRSDGSPVIDLTELTTLSVECFDEDEMDAVRTVLMQGEQLTKFDLTGKFFLTSLISLSHLILFQYTTTVTSRLQDTLI